MPKHTKKSSKKIVQHNPLLTFVIAGLLMVALGVAGDALFADYHVAIYGSMPVSDGYTPVQKSSVSSVSNRAATRATKRIRATRPAATSSSRSLSSSSLASSAPTDYFAPIDGSKCVDGNPAGCTKLIRALAMEANPACLRINACEAIVIKAGATSECRKNEVCQRAYLSALMFSNLPDCVTNTVSCKRVFPEIKAQTDAVFKRSNP